MRGWLTGKALADIQADAQGVTGKCGEEILKADLLLSAVGRKPVTDALKLENAGLKTNERGFIEVDDYGRTKVVAIFAIAAFMRLYRFDQVPFGTWYDEANAGLEALRIINEPGYLPVFSQ